ncbi:hypothetical protein PCL_10439 [Purpureocillium lilacinum]|uniref:Uncharacterized protein n=1 Tax=Purpureocillium lilacinum TaxID=33203 RepID=A0A2U3DQC8_PURLI|nr:hypothetical protein PCL_10439 [Purpureocillium lilacinum]
MQPRSLVNMSTLPPASTLSTRNDKGSRTIITLAIVYNGDTRETEISLRDMFPKRLKRFVLDLLRLPLDSSIAVERYSSSKAAYVMLNPENSFMCEKLRKAARFNSKLKRHSVVKLRVTRFDHVKPELWLRWPPILDRILQHLSGSESALLLSILHLLRDRCLVRKHVTPIRDLPEYADWIELMVSKGHTVFLLGEDVENLRFRLEKPQTYWAEGRATLAFKEQGRPFTDQDPGPSPRIAGKSRYWLTSDGDLQYPKTVEEVRHFRRLEASGTVQLNGKLIPTPGMSHGIRNSDLRSAFRHTRSNWQKTTIKNSNSIDIVCADDCGHVYDDFSQQVTDPRITPMFQFCPTKRERQTEYLEKSHMRHDYGMVAKSCLSTIFLGIYAAILLRKKERVLFYEASKVKSGYRQNKSGEKRLGFGGGRSGVPVEEFMQFVGALWHAHRPKPRDRDAHWTGEHTRTLSRSGLLSSRLVLIPDGKPTMSLKGFAGARPHPLVTIGYDSTSIQSYYLDQNLGALRGNGSLKSLLESSFPPRLVTHTAYSRPATTEAGSLLIKESAFLSNGYEAPGRPSLPSIAEVVSSTGLDQYPRLLADTGPLRPLIPGSRRVPQVTDQRPLPPAKSGIDHHHYAIPWDIASLKRIPEQPPTPACSQLVPRPFEPGQGPLLVVPTRYPTLGEGPGPPVHREGADYANPARYDPPLERDFEMRTYRDSLTRIGSATHTIFNFAETYSQTAREQENSLPVTQPLPTEREVADMLAHVDQIESSVKLVHGVVQKYAHRQRAYEGTKIETMYENSQEFPIYCDGPHSRESVQSEAKKRRGDALQCLWPALREAGTEEAKGGTVHTGRTEGPVMTEYDMTGSAHDTRTALAPDNP